MPFVFHGEHHLKEVLESLGCVLGTRRSGHLALSLQPLSLQGRSYFKMT